MNSRGLHSPNLFCPFLSCPQHKNADKPRGFNTKLVARDHLMHEHQHELYRLSDSQLESCELCLCRVCETHLFTAPGYLKKHFESNHIGTRTKNNYKVITCTLFDPVKNATNNYWSDGLEWLHSFEPSPPTFRQSLISKIKYDLEDEITKCMEEVIEICVEVNKVSTDKNSRDSQEFSREGIWKLPFIFEQLVLCPKPYQLRAKDKSGPSIRQIVRRRLRLFRSGQLQLLFEESQQVRSKSAAAFREAPPSTHNAAQEAANEDNFRSANARLSSDTPVAPINDSNIHIVHKLFPPSLNLKLRSLRSTRTQKTVCSLTQQRVIDPTKDKVIFSPSEVLELLSRLRRHKAPGFLIDSLDIYLKLVRRRIKENRKGKQSPKATATTLAKFFTIIANGDVDETIKKYLTTTYFVALQKDLQDITKLRPLGVPSAIRRITAALVINRYKSQFATNLLPYNYAVGINGGVDVITHSIRLGVDKYITKREANNELPTRALVSVDIKNMFNAISRQKLRQLISESFPSLSAFADLLYDEPGKIRLKRDDGTWDEHPVPEGFTQGCPISPIFAGLVLGDILTRIDKELYDKTGRRLRSGHTGDDGKGGLALIMAYVDDINCLLPLEDVKFFLDRFKFYGEKYGAIMNTEKTRILTSTSGSSLLPRLRHPSAPNESSIIANELDQAINTYSRTYNKVTEEYHPIEVVDGLRVLGVPIGNSTFCSSFLSKALAKAKRNTSNIISGLSDDQTILQLYRSCTATKLTHLFASDILSSDKELPAPGHWNLWSSEFCNEFDQMTNQVLARLTQTETIPLVSTLISAIPTTSGGLGIQNPDTTAIPSFMLSFKRVLSYFSDGINVGRYHPNVDMPPAVASLFENWQSSSAKPFTTFRHYLSPLVNICVQNNTGNNTDFFIKESSINTCRTRIKEIIGQRARKFVIRLFQDSEDYQSISNIDDILDNKLGQGLLDMSRIPEENRLENTIFSIMLKRKLRLNLYPGTGKLICPKCKQHFDRKGDHLFRCKHMSKTIMSNQWRDKTVDICKDILPLVGLITNASEIETEEKKLVTSLRNTRIAPMDMSFNVSHSTGDSCFRCPLDKIGFDMTCIHNDICPDPTIPIAQYNNLNLQLEEGEQNKFQRSRGGTDPLTKESLSGDQIIGEIIDNNMALLPMAITPFGKFGPIANRFWYGTSAHIPPKLYTSRDKPNAIKAAKLSIEAKVPSGILQRANKVWRIRHPGKMYGASYKAMDPKTHTNQLFGRLVCTANGAHILRSMKKFDKFGGPIPVIAQTGDNPIGNSIYTEQAADPCSNMVDNSENVGVSIDSIMTHNMPRA